MRRVRARITARRRTDQRRGICKIEVALVVVILGLTAALAVPGWQREQREKAEKAAAKKAAAATATRADGAAVPGAP